jgi:hypothetical protein
MKRIIMVLAVAALMAAMAIASAVPAFAVPSEEDRHGTCLIGGRSDKGARGCAGNIGGHIDTQNAECKNINRGPFNEGKRSCGFLD